MTSRILPTFYTLAEFARFKFYATDLSDNRGFSDCALAAKTNELAFCELLDFVKIFSRQCADDKCFDRLFVRNDHRFLIERQIALVHHKNGRYLLLVTIQKKLFHQIPVRFRLGRNGNEYRVYVRYVWTYHTILSRVYALDDFSVRFDVISDKDVKIFLDFSAQRTNGYTFLRFYAVLPCYRLDDLSFDMRLLLFVFSIP